MAGAPTPEAGEEQVYIADSVNEFVERERWRQILEAREIARDAIRDYPQHLAQLRHDGVTGEEAKVLATRVVRSAVESYVLECEPFFKNTETGEEFWSEEEISSVPVLSLVSPPRPEADDLHVSGIEQVETADDTDLRLSRREDGAIAVRVRGVGDYVEIGETPIVYEYRVEDDDDRNPVVHPNAGTRTDQATIRLPREVARDVCRLTDELLTEVAPGLDIGESDGRASWDPDDYREE